MSSTTTQKTHVPDKWDATKIPSLQGKVTIVTGANSGIGYETALELARKGADVMLAYRSEESGKAAEKKLQEELATTPGAEKVEFAKLDVSSLKSVKEFSTKFLNTHDHLDLLINNAGILTVPHALTADGVESQFATNHLGHFALTAQLFDLLKTSTPPHIVNVTSGAHRDAFDFTKDDIMLLEAKYSPYTGCANSKLCNMLFTKELDRRIKAAGIQGVTAASPAMGALPTLYAAAGPHVQGGDYFGPRGFMTMWGYPTLEKPSKQSDSESAAAKLWTLSKHRANVSFEITPN